MDVAAQTGTYAGRYSDGRTAATYAVSVSLTGTGVEIIWPDRPLAERWSYAKLRSATPISWRDNEVLLRSMEHPGATLFVTDPGIASAILKLAPRLSPGAHRWRYAMPGLVLTGALIAGISAIYMFQWHPAQTIARLIPHSLRAAIGSKAALELAGTHDTCEATDGSKALATLVRKLTTASHSDKPFHVRVVQWDLVNAFAVPGEEIVISGGLIDKAESADEVAGVIAHEMGHGIELHPEAGIIRGLGISALLELFASGHPGSLSNAGALLLELQYSREAEHEADAHALRILKNADISPKPFADFFDRLQKLEGGSPSPPAKDGKDSSTYAPSSMQIFATHPPTPERAKMAADAATYPGKPSLSDDEWQALKNICD